MDDGIKHWQVAYVIKVMISKTAKADKGQTSRTKHMDSVNSTALQALIREHNTKCFEPNSEKFYFKEPLQEHATHVSIHLDILTILAVLLAKLFYS